jgi:carbon monoxide dehydrogenase subunit G
LGHGVELLEAAPQGFGTWRAVVFAGEKAAQLGERLCENYLTKVVK